MKFKLQSYSDGAIYKLDNGSYEVETSQGKATGATVAEAIKSLSDLAQVPKHTVKRRKKSSRKVKVIDESPLEREIEITEKK